LNLIPLLGDEQPGVTNDVDEQDVPDLKFHVGRGFRWHEISFHLRNRI
jgi:hypothetical protein